MALDKVVKQSRGIEIPAGTHVGILQSIIHVGIQKNTYEGLTSYKDQVIFMFELPDTLLDNGNPVTISKRETNSANDKANMIKLIKALGGDTKEGAELDKLIGKPVMLELKENSKKTGVNITGYMPVPEVLKKTLKPLVGEPKLLLDVERIGDKELKELPEWMQKVINSRVSNEKPVNPNVDY